MPTSPDTLLRRINQTATADAPTPRVLGVDDWAIPKGQNDGTILVDLLVIGKQMSRLPPTDALGAGAVLRRAADGEEADGGTEGEYGRSTGDRRGVQRSVVIGGGVHHADPQGAVDDADRMADESGVVAKRPGEGFARGVRQDEAAVSAAMTQPWSNGSVEGQVNRLKTIKRQMYGRAGFALLRRRVLHAS